MTSQEKESLLSHCGESSHKKLEQHNNILITILGKNCYFVTFSYFLYQPLVKTGSFMWNEDNFPLNKSLFT